MHMCLSRVQLFVALWTVARQAPLFMDSPGKNTGVGCHALLQGIFPTQGSNLKLLWRLQCWQILYCWAIGGAHLKLYTWYIFSPLLLTFLFLLLVLTISLWYALMLFPVCLFPMEFMEFFGSVNLCFWFFFLNQIWNFLTFISVNIFIFPPPRPKIILHIC